MNKNTKIRIKVPKSLYESIQQQIKKESVKTQESGQYYGERAMKGGIQMEEEEVMNEGDMLNTIMQGIQEVPAMYDLLRQKAQMAPNEFNVLVSGIGTILGVGGTLGAAALSQLKNKMKGEKGNTQSEEPSAMSEKKKPEEEVVKEFSMEQLSEAVKKAKAKKAAAAKEKEKAAAAKEKEKEAAKKEKEKEAAKKK
jgi:hypothetical protein